MGLEHNEIFTIIPLILQTLQSSVLELVDYSVGEIYIEVQSAGKVGHSLDISKEFHFGCMYKLDGVAPLMTDPPPTNFTSFKKLDGVGPVDNRPSTD